MNRYLSGVPDTDLKILEYLSDRELLSQCIVNSYANNLCQKESLWLNRFIQKYGKDNLIYKPKDMKWREFYLKLIANPDQKANFFEEKGENRKSIAYVKQTLPKGFIVNHERWTNKPFSYPEEYRKFELFWTSPGEKSYYGGNKLLRYVFQLDKEMHGIKVTLPLEEFKTYIYNLYKNIKNYKLPEVISDSSKDLWYAILEDDLLGFPVDFINLYDEEIIFSNKNLKYLI